MGLNPSCEATLGKRYHSILNKKQTKEIISAERKKGNTVEADDLEQLCALDLRDNNPLVRLVMYITLEGLIKQMISKWGPDDTTVAMDPASSVVTGEGRLAKKGREFLRIASRNGDVQAALVIESFKLQLC